MTSTPSSCISLATLPTNCAASVCITACGARCLTALTISSIGLITPTSLFAAITETNAVSGVSTSNIASGEMRHPASGATSATSRPSAKSLLRGSKIQGCSINVETIRPDWRAHEATIVLLASVAPEVKITVSPGCAPTNRRTEALASSTVALARCPPR